MPLSALVGVKQAENHLTSWGKYVGTPKGSQQNLVKTTLVTLYIDKAKPEHVHLEEKIIALSSILFPQNADN